MSTNRWILIGVTLIFNLVCGWFRVRQEKLRWKLLYIHLPIPFVAWIRITSGVSWTFIPVLVLVAVVGQFAGGRLNFPQP